MKKFILLLIAFVCALPVLAQSPSSQSKIIHPAFTLADSLILKAAEPESELNVVLLTDLANWWQESPNTLLPRDSQHYNYNSNLKISDYNTFLWNQDSVSLRPSVRFLYTYNGNDQEVIYQSWREDSLLWKNISKSLIQRNSQEHLLSNLSQVWNDTSSNWQNSTLTNYERDSQGRDTSTLTFNWNPSTQAWDSSGRSSTVWSPFQPVFTVAYTDRVAERYVKDSLKWVLSNEQHNTFDNRGNLTESIQFFYFVNFISGSRGHWIYNGNDQSTFRTSDIWDVAKQEWSPNFQVSLAYKGPGIFDFDTITTQQWMVLSDTGDWHNDFRETFDDPAPDTSIVKTEIGVNKGEWINDGLRVRVDIPGRELVQQEIQQSWTGTAWENDSKTDYSYDQDDNLTLEVGLRWESSQWIEQTQSRYYYGQFVGLNRKELSSLKFFPNPATTHLRLEIEPQTSSAVQLEIFSLQGQLVHSFEKQWLTAGKQFLNYALTDLLPGIYVLKFSIGDELKVGKLVKQ